MCLVHGLVFTDPQSAVVGGSAEQKGRVGPSLSRDLCNWTTRCHCTPCSQTLKHRRGQHINTGSFILLKCIKRVLNADSNKRKITKKSFFPKKCIRCLFSDIYSRVHWGSISELQRTFYAKKGSMMTRKNPFGTKVLYRLLFIHILHYSATFCSCN